MGHNTCLDLFGPPSDEEERAGVTVHGEASVLPYELVVEPTALTARCTLPVSQLAFERRLELDEQRIRFTETVENLSALDRPIAWTEHVTLGPPFLECGMTQFRAPAAPKDFETYTDVAASGGYTTHLLDSSSAGAWFFAYSPEIPGRVRLRLAAERFSVARRVGGELQPQAAALERAYAGPGHGVRRFAIPGNASCDD